MFFSDGLGVNSENHLTVGGCDAVALAREYKTPLYVMDEGEIRRRCSTYKKAADKYFDGRSLVCFASKALCNLEIMRVVADEGLGADVVSGGELFTALKAGMPPEKLCMHGNNKSDDELRFAVESGVGRIVADNFCEIERISGLAEKLNKTQKILLRVTPGIDAHTHEYILTGKIDSKFGVPLDGGGAKETVGRALALPHVKIAGVHAHIGSQIFELEPFRATARKLMTFIAEIKAEFSHELCELNLGGGFGVAYTEQDDDIDVDAYIKAIAETVFDCAAGLGLNRPFMLFEPGRAIVAAAGVTLYTAGGVKDIPNIRRYVLLDGGMGDNPRYILYGAQYAATVANRAGGEKTQRVTLAGKCCESGDLVGENMPLQDVNRGDIIAVFTTGAYNYSMASNYNRIPRPAMVMVKDGKSRLIVRRETYEDIVKNDI